MKESLLRPRLSRTSSIPKPTYYVDALDGEFREYAYNEERAQRQKGLWREAFGVSDLSLPMDLEIGTGNGYHFAHYAEANPDRLFVGIEIKYKPLIQAIRRSLRAGAKNAKVMRYHANYLDDIFAEGELNKVMIHFPDPWLKRRQTKNRLINPEFLKSLYRLQRPGSVLEFKTDSREYFDVAFEDFKSSEYELLGHSYDLHNSEFAEENFMTHFEKIFSRQNIPINFARLRKK